MIRRIQKNNDLKDIIKSRPKGVIDDIYEVRYYIYGNESKYIAPALEREGDVLVAVLASQDLQHLANGILYRKAFYRVPDASYPDGYYDIEFVDNMEIWLGDVKKDEPSEEYLTADDLKTINGESVVGVGNIEIEGGLTPEQEEAIEEAITKADAAGAAAQTAFDVAEEAKGVAESALEGLADKADKSEIPSLEGYATEEWVEGKGYLTEHQPLKTINGESVIGEGDIEISGSLTPEQAEKIAEIDNKADKSEIPTVPENVSAFNNDAGYLTEHQPLKTINGESVIGEGDIEISGSLTPEQAEKITEIDNKADKSEIPSLDGYATESWVEGKGYLTEHQSLAGYATESWVEGKGYLTEVPSDYAKKTDIPTIPENVSAFNNDAGYLTEHQSLDGYATEDFVSETDEARKQWVLDQGYTANKGTVTSITVMMNGATVKKVTTSGTVDLGTVITEHQDISGKVDKSSIWTGSEAQWNTLTEEQKASYIIALITE